MGYRMDFKPSDTEGFIVTHHGPELQPVSHVREVEKMISYITRASTVSLVFGADETFVSYLDRAIKNGCVSEVGLLCKDKLPESAVSRFPSNPQTQPKPLETLKALDENLRAPRRGSNHSHEVAAITASFARQGFLSTKQNATSGPTAGESPKRAGRKSVIDEPRNLAPHNASFARMRENLDAWRGPVIKQAPKDSGGGSSDKSQSKISIASSARSSGNYRATDDAFSRFQARLKGQGTSLPDPMAKFTENTRKKVSMVNDWSIASSSAQTARLDTRSASVSPDIVSLSTSNEALARNPFVNSQAVKAELSIRDLNIDQPQQQAEAPVQKQSVSKELSGRNDFNTQYRSKYKDIRSIFDTLHRSAEASPSENQLFRRLGEAYIMEDTDEFENVYTELLRLIGVLASGIADSG